LRRLAQQAAASSDTQRQRQVAQKIVTELIRRGVLVQVAVQRGSGTGRPLCVLRHTNRLVDLSCLEPDTSPAPVSSAAPVSDDTPPPSGDASGNALMSYPGVDALLRAMEEAQNLEAGDPRSRYTSFVLDGILKLLNGFLPGFRLYLMLPEGEEILPDQRHLFTAGEAAREPLWLAQRPAGNSVWISSALGMPEFIVEETRRRASDVTTSDAADGQEFPPAVAVPLAPPEAAADDTGDGSGEAGLLFVVPERHVEKSTLFRFAHRVSQFVARRWREQNDVNQQIHTDSLTGVYNRKYFDLQFSREVERARRGKSALTLVICDLDFFKGFNDTYGHQVGDSVLQVVARHLLSALRRIDHVCRIGGEEFALILPQTSATEAHEIMSRLIARALTLDAETASGSERIRITLSYGAVSFPAGGEDAFELYRKADAMLYAAKAQGRNQCHFWNPDGENHLVLRPRDNDADD